MDSPKTNTESLVYDADLADAFGTIQKNARI
jgi:hypothetical protein